MHLNPDPFDLIDTHGGAITRAFMLICHGSQKCRFLVASDSFHLTGPVLNPVQISKGGGFQATSACFV